MIYWYHDETGQRTAVILSKARKWMRVALIDAGRIKVKKMPISEERFMQEMDLGKAQRRKSFASLRRLARKKGTPTKLRNEITEVLRQ